MKETEIPLLQATHSRSALRERLWNGGGCWMKKRSWGLEGWRHNDIQVCGSHLESCMAN